MKKVIIAIMMALTLVNITGCKKTETTEIEPAKTASFNAQEMLTGVQPVRAELYYTDHGNFLRVVRFTWQKSPI